MIAIILLTAVITTTNIGKGKTVKHHIVGVFNLIVY